MTSNSSEGSYPPLSLAVVGMSGRFPGAQNVHELWQNLITGTKSIQTFSDEELLAAGVDAALLNNANYVKVGSVLEGADLFDAAFFGFNPREAETMDPQTRLFLLCAWEALEDAAYDPTTYKAPIGVFAGKGFPTYMIGNVLPHPDIADLSREWQVTMSNETDSLASTVAYKMDLRGPSVSVQTFCSTSLVAVHMACQSLLAFECDLALAGGVAVVFPQGTGYLYQEGGILSPDGECRAWDATANGSVMGNGVGVVALKRLDDALDDGDRIYAIIRGSSTNNDGLVRVGYTAPGLNGQAAVIATALANADVDPRTISYVETHGTGTPLGDSIELAAMCKAFQQYTDDVGFCGIGSVKPNIGHLDRASGVTGLIKTVLALHHGMLPPSLNFETPHPDSDLNNTPFYVNTTAKEWLPNGNWPRRAGVSSFGLGGTNVHMVLEEMPAREHTDDSRPHQLLLLSAKTESSLEIATARLVTYLQENPSLSLADVAYTLQVGRADFNYRRMVVCHSLEDGVDALALANPRRVFTTHQTYRERPVIFMFAGVGNHYVGMGRELYQTEPTFRKWVDDCCDLLQQDMGIDLREILYSPEAIENISSPQEIDLRQMVGRNSQPAATTPLSQTAVAQPAVFVIEYALAQLLMEWGIQPQGLIGYSLGEYVAACLAGVLSLEDALKLVAKRAQMIQALPEGAMLAVPLSAAALAPYLTDELSLAAVNGPMMCIVAGPVTAVTMLEAKMAEQDIACRPLTTSHAFHSSMMAPIATDLTDLVSGFQLTPPHIPYLSNVTGTWITAVQATDPGYWATHLQQPVQFALGIEELLQDPDLLLLEIGPGNALGSIAKLHPNCSREQGQYILPTLPALYEQQSDRAFLLNALGKMWLSGVQIDWYGFYQHEQRNRVSLPTYPFALQRYWIEPERNSQTRANGQARRKKRGDAPLTIADLLEAELEKIPDISDWIYTSSWQRMIPHPPLDLSTALQGQDHSWLIFADAHQLGETIAQQLRSAGQPVIVVRSGTQFAYLGQNEYTIHPAQAADYAKLIKDLQRQDQLPTKIVHMWTVTPLEEDAILTDETLQKFLEFGFYSLFHLTRALGDVLVNSCQIAIISSDMQDVMGNTQINPAKAMVLGPYKVIPQEMTNIRCCSIDITFSSTYGEQKTQLVRQLLDELVVDLPQEMIALRGMSRWVQTYEPTPLVPDSGHTQRLRKEGVYLITGGLGGIGLAFAHYLVDQYQAKIVLINRSGLPERQTWAQILAETGDTDGVGYRIRQVQALENKGAAVLVLTADVSNREQMAAAVQQAKAHFGTIHGVIHAAGMLAQGLTVLKEMETVAAVLASKVQGTLVLHDVLQGIDLDFFVLVSSMSSITGGGPGQIDYCSANAFMDAFARRYVSENGFTVSIGWGEWQWDAWQEGLQGFPEAVREFFKAKRQHFGISFAEGYELLTRVLTHSLPHVIVSTQDFKAVAKGSSHHSTDTILEEQRKSQIGQAKYPRPTLGTPYAAPGSDLEIKISDMWSDLLGIEQIGIHDNFFELGGNSLFGANLIMRIRKEMDVESLPLYILYDTPTVSEMAKYIDNNQEKTTLIAQERARGQLRRQRNKRHKLAG